MNIRHAGFLAVLFLGCAAQKEVVPSTKNPSAIEQQVAIPLNACQRGKYYRLLKYRHDMEFYLDHPNQDVAIQAAKNLKKVDDEIYKIIVLGNNRRNNKNCFK